MNVTARPPRTLDDACDDALEITDHLLLAHAKDAPPETCERAIARCIGTRALLVVGPI